MMINKLKKSVPKGFDRPIDHPSSPEEAQDWQKQNVAWWETHPMRYDWKENIGAEKFSKEFYQEIDKRFFETSKDFAPYSLIPFETFIDFNELMDKNVLEIGIGNGSHAQLLAQYAKSFTGIDITNYAVRSTRERMRLFGHKADIFQMDAEKMAFPDESFDFVWSWGVIHHSSNTKKIIGEIHRVLKNKGEAVIMVYYRSWWNYYFIWGVKVLITGEIFKTHSLHKNVQYYVDGAFARYYTIKEFLSLLGDMFFVKDIGVYGSNADIVPLPNGKLKTIILNCMPNLLNYFLAHKLRMGGFLVIKMRKQAATVSPARNWPA